MNKGQLALIDALRIELAAAQAQIKNQQAQITGHHKYTGQDFEFRIKKLEDELAAKTKDADHFFQLSGKYLEQRNAARDEAEESKRLHMDLIMQVARCHPNETRHETAKRYITQAESGAGLSGCVAAIAKDAK
jgi:hypothetical protein